jgi:hypothetical protein
MGHLMGALGSKKPWVSKTNLRRFEEQVAKARRMVQRQKGLGPPNEYFGCWKLICLDLRNMGIGLRAKVKMVRIHIG